jgi:hypothetical protein
MNIQALAFDLKFPFSNLEKLLTLYFYNGKAIFYPGPNLLTAVTDSFQV